MGAPVSVGYPYSDALKVRDFETKDFHWTNYHSGLGLFGKERFAAGSHKFITITEGEYDALSIYEVLRSPAVSVQSAGSALRDCTVDRGYLNSFDRIYLAFDADAPGRAAVEQVARLFDRDKVFVVRFSNRKDANEYLVAGEREELRNIWHNAKPYLPDNLKSSLEDFKKILTEKTELGIPYPWPTLTKMTYGIRMGECVLFIAKEKVGKTTIMHEILHHLLKETDYAVGAYFLEEPKKRLLQSLAGIATHRPIHLPDSGVSDDEAYSSLEALLQRSDRLFVYDYFGSNDPDVLIDSIRYLVTACSVRVVILDHITISVSGMAGDGDERRKLDYLTTKLEMLVKELNFALIIVSHVNDEGQTRGSRYPTKVSDITVRLERDLEHIDPVQRNIINLSVPYNRFCSSTGSAGSLLFSTETYTHQEISNDGDSGVRH